MSVKRIQRRRLVNVIAAFLLLGGAVLLFAPVVEGALAQREMDQEISKVEQTTASVRDEQAGKAGSAPFDELFNWLQAYNQQVASGAASIAADPFLFEGAMSEFETQGLENGLIGYIQIPAMSTSLPLYLGSTTEHLRRGATVVEGSSAPLGESTSNCLIAAHRGYGSPSMMFRDIERLCVGDKVYVTTLWETLTYTVVGTKVIDPSDTEAVGIQQGRDLVTLITCHPYGSTASRYVVECERTVDEKNASAENQPTQGTPTVLAETGSDSRIGPSLPEIEDGLRIAGGIILVACAVILAVRAVRARRPVRTRGKHSK